MTSKRLRAVFASCLGGGFGVSPNQLPWPRETKDLLFFKKQTLECNGVIFAGRKTAEGLPMLPGRSLFVVSETKDLDTTGYSNPVHGVFSYQQFLNLAPALSGTVIGGATLLTPQVLDQCGEVYHTVFTDVYPSDVSLSKETLAWLGFHLPKAKIILNSENFLVRKYTSA